MTPMARHPADLTEGTGSSFAAKICSTLIVMVRTLFILAWQISNEKNISNHPIIDCSPHKKEQVLVSPSLERKIRRM